MNFNIVEGEDTYLSEIYPDFKREFLNGTSINDIKVMFDISERKYYRLQKRVREETGLICKPKSKCRFNKFNEDYYIYKRDSDNYYIYKTLDGKTGYFGVYDSLEKAKFVRDELIKCDWDKSKLNQIITNLNIMEEE